MESQRTLASLRERLRRTANKSAKPPNAVSSAMREMETQAIAAISNLGLEAKLLGWNRATISDIQPSITFGLQRVHTADNLQ